MQSLIAFAAPLALMLPLMGQSSALPVSLAAGEATVSESAPEPNAKPIRKAQPVGTTAPTTVNANPINTLRESQTVRQVRIEQRVIVRISPARGRNANRLLNDLPRQELTARYEERKTDKCLPVAGIAGVQTGSGNRLLLFLRDRRIISVNLEKTCRARDFYSGFYVERSKDGNLCIKRDKLQSRTGAKCEVARMRQLVAVKSD